MRIKGSLDKDDCTLRHASLPSNHWECFLLKLEMNVAANFAGAQNCVWNWATWTVAPPSMASANHRKAVIIPVVGKSKAAWLWLPQKYGLSKKNPPLILCSKPIWATRHETHSVTSSHVWRVRGAFCKRLVDPPWATALDFLAWGG